MPKRITTCALTLLDKDDLGGITLGVNAKASPGAQIVEWSIDWDDEETEDNTIPLPSTAKHSYIEGGARLIILTVKDSKNKFISVGLNVLIVRNPTVTAPAIPNPLNSSLISNNQIDLSWSNVGNETGYELQCQIDGGSFFVRTQLPFNTTSFTDLQVTPGHTYTYRVRAFNAGGFSSFSNTTSQTTGGATVYDYIVSTSGSDGVGVPGNLAQPFATVKHALEVASGTLSGSGKIIGVRGLGVTYIQSVDGPSATGTSWTNKLRVQNYEGETVLIQPASGNFILGFQGNQKFIEFDGINYNGANIGDASVRIDIDLGGNPSDIRLMNGDLHHREGPGNTNAAIDVVGDNCQFFNLTVHGTGGPYAFYLAVSNGLVDSCEMYSISTYGVHIYHTAGTPTGNIVRNCIIRDITQSWFFSVSDGHVGGILIAGLNNQAYNNVIYNINCTAFWAANPPPSGIDTANNGGVVLYPGSNGTKVWFNTFTNNVLWAVNLNDWSGPITNAVVQNNISWQNTSGDYRNAGGYSVTLDHNSWQAPVSGANPLFVSSTNFHLQAGSPCKGQGVLVASVPTDQDGNLRSNPPSQGCFE